MNEMKIFENPEFGAIRTVEVKNEPWFVGKDVAEILGYSNTNKAIQVHVDERDKAMRSQWGTEMGKLFSSVKEMQEKLGRQDNWFINESGLYSLILSSKLPNAKKFKRWVTSEVLPAIRKTGGYINGSESMSDDEIMARALLMAQKTIENNKERISQLESDNNRMRPKEIFADAVAASDQTILIGDLAKLIKQNGYDIGQKRLFEWLRQNCYLIKRKGADYNSPTQRAMEMGLFRIKETSITCPDGHTKVNKTTKVTGKGQQYFLNLFLSEDEEDV